MRLVALAATVLLGAASPEPKPLPPEPICYDIFDFDRKVIIVICFDKMRDPNEPKLEL